MSEKRVIYLSDNDLKNIIAERFKTKPHNVFLMSSYDDEFDAIEYTATIVIDVEMEEECL